MSRSFRKAIALAAVAAGLGAGSAAQAGTITGTLSGAAPATVTGGGSGLVNITDFTLTSAIVLAASGDLAADAPFLSTITFGPATITVSNVNGAPFATGTPVMTFGGGRFVFTPSTAQFSGIPPIYSGGILTLSASGALHDTTAALGDSTALLSITLTQASLNGPVIAAISFESTGQPPANQPLAAPAPAGLVLAATAVPALGLGRLIRRKKAAA